MLGTGAGNTDSVQALGTRRTDQPKGTVMYIRQRRFIMLCALLAGGIGSSAWSQTEPSGDSNALSGPKVASQAPKATLVEKDGTGKLVRLEQRPEQAALELLGLTTEERKKPDELLIKRASVVSRLLADHRELFQKIQTARQGGAGRQELAPLMMEFHEVAGDLIDHPLAEQLKETLPERTGDRFTTLVKEYNDALVAEEAANRPQDMGSGENRSLKGGPMAQRRIEANMLLKEMGRTLKAVVTENKERTEGLLKAIDASPELASKIEAVFRANLKGGVRNTPEERGQAMRRVMELLTPEQRAKAREYFQNRN